MGIFPSFEPNHQVELENAAVKLALCLIQFHSCINKSIAPIAAVIQSMVLLVEVILFRACAAAKILQNQRTALGAMHNSVANIQRLNHASEHTWYAFWQAHSEVLRGIFEYRWWQY
jgi:hypothetical protein